MSPAAGLIFANSIPTAPSTLISPPTLFFLSPVQQFPALHLSISGVLAPTQTQTILCSNCPINHNLCHNSIPPRPGSIKERGEGGENTCSINEGRSQGHNLLTYWSQSKNPPHKTFFSLVCFSFCGFLSGLLYCSVNCYNEIIAAVQLVVAVLALAVVFNRSSVSSSINYCRIHSRSCSSGQSDSNNVIEVVKRGKCLEEANLQM